MPKTIDTITIAQAINMLPVLQSVSQLRGMQPVVAFRLARFLDKINKEFVTFDRAKMQLASEMGTQTTPPPGSPPGQVNYDIPPDKMPEFNDQINAMAQELIHLPKGFVPITLEDIAPVGLAPIEIGVLLPIMDDGDEEDTALVYKEATTEQDASSIQ